MRMARVNVYLPDELADEARAAGINVSSLTQDALRRELGARRSTTWLEQVGRLPATQVTHDEVLEALDAAVDEMGGRDG